MKTLQSVLSFVHSLAFASLASTALAVPPQYIAYDLGTLGGTDSTAYGINNASTVVGASYTADRHWHAFSYSNGHMTDLGALGGNASEATAINSSGTIVGTSQNAFSYSNGQVTDLGTLGGGGSQGYAVNAGGTVVGASQNSSGHWHAFSYSNGHMTDLGTLSSTETIGTGINDAGTIVGFGFSLQGGGSEYAFSYSNGHMSDIGTLGIILSGFARAYAINNAGTIVGMSDYHAFSYSNGHMTDLGTLGGALGVSEALAINNAGTIVGMNSADNGPAHAFVYRNGHMTDLAPFLATVGLSGNSAANAINDHGDIAGWGITADNHNHAFLLKAPSLAVTCPPEGMIDCASNVSATIMDPEAQALTAVWRVGLTPVQTNLVPAGSSLSTNILLQMGLPAGPNLVSLEVADGTGRSALCSSVVTVKPSEPIIVSAGASPNILWPPDHRLVPITLQVETTDPCAAADWEITDIRSSEPVNGGGDGSTFADWTLSGKHSLAVRAERSGSGPGRTYFITLRAQNTYGKFSAPTTVTITVPRNRALLK